MAEDDRDVYDLSRFKRASENGQENGHDDEHIKCKQSSKKVHRDVKMTMFKYVPRYLTTGN